MSQSTKAKATCATETDDTAPRLVEELLKVAESTGVSDVHLQMVGKEATVVFRLDGVMAPFKTLDSSIADRVFGRIKFLAKLKTYQESMPQDGRIDRSDLGVKNDIRVATYPTVTGEKIVLRLFTRTDGLSIEQLELESDVQELLVDFLRGNAGLLLLTGPAGSGKTTTIYACLRWLAKEGGRHVITVEDPVEQLVPGIMQTEVNEARGLTFSKAARHLLRQDPQVLVIGEIRDEETADIVVRAALTGHMVISTLHAGDCQSVFERLLNMCTDRYAAISAVKLILNQRLVRKYCPKCQGKKCDDCMQTGYKGRIPVCEWLRSDEKLQGAIRSTGPQVIKIERNLKVAARKLVQSNFTSGSEIDRVMGL